MTTKILKRSVFLLVLSVLFVSCNTSKSKNNQMGLIATFGDQPSTAQGPNNEIAIVFGEKDNIYFSESNDEGESFSEPTLVGTLKDLVLGYSSGPSIAITKNSIVVTAPDRSGNLYAWTKSLKKDTWSGPFRVNELNGSVGESLSAITATPEGRLFCTWIDTRILEKNDHEEHSVKNKSPENHRTEVKQELDLAKMTPTGITYKALLDKIGDYPKNAKLAFHGDNDGNIFWVFLDSDGNAVKAENIEAFKKFREQNKSRPKIEGKIYVTASDDGGQSWSKSELVYQSPDGSVCECCKPSISSDSNGNVYIMFRNNINGSRDLHVTKSMDNGKTFSAPEKMGTGTWKIDGCPMDGGGIAVKSNKEFSTIWQREGEIFMANSNSSENQIGYGRSPSIASNGSKTTIVYSSGEDIMVTDAKEVLPKKIGTGSFPKIVSINESTIYFWVNEEGINYKRT